MIKSKSLGLGEAGVSGLSLSSRGKTSKGPFSETESRNKHQKNGPSNLDLLPPLPPLPRDDHTRSISRQQRERSEETTSSKNGSNMAASAMAQQQDAGSTSKEGGSSGKENPLAKVKNATGGILARATRSKSIRGRKNKAPPMPEVAPPALPSGPPSPNKVDTPVEQVQQRDHLRPRPDSPHQQQHLRAASPADAMARPTTGTTIVKSSTHSDKNFFNKFKAQGHNFHIQGEKTAKAVAEKGRGAWHMFKSKSFKNDKMNGGSGDGKKKKKEMKPPIDVFNLPLRDAVLGTRVAKEREEGNLYAFWMPAIAYRCIEFLNVHGPTELGIYRIPGSTAVVDDLKLEFVQCYDVDLLETPPNDVHTVSSLLKAWLRSLPEAILPADVQSRVYEKCKGFTDQEKPPQDFVDEIAQLPPYNYYMLKALFAHLRDVNQASEINKMNLANLGMVFCSTLRIDRFCFNWLVTGWAECWDGCANEMDEYERIMKPPSMMNSSARDFDSVSSRSRGHPSPGLPTPQSGGSNALPHFDPSSPTAASHPSSPAFISTSSAKFISPASPGHAPPSPNYSQQTSPAYYTTKSSPQLSPSLSRRPSTVNAEPPTPMFSLPPPSFSSAPAPPPTPSSAAILTKPMTLPPYIPPVELPAEPVSPPQMSPPPPPKTPENKLNGGWMGLGSPGKDSVGEVSPRRYELKRIDTTKASLAPLLPEIAPVSPLMGGPEETRA